MVNFKPTDEQELIRETMAGFAREVLRRHGREADERNEVPDEVVQRGWELGLVQAAIPEAFGGYGDSYSALTGALLIEELAYGDAALALHLLAPRLLTVPLIALGNEAIFLEHIPHLKEHFAFPAQVEGGFYKTPQEPGASADMILPCEGN